MKLKTGMLAGLALLAMGTSAQAALLGRMPLTPGGTDYQAYYDTDLNITWLADANAGAHSDYDDGPSTTPGRMSWARAQNWIGSLNSANYLGVSNWRLPNVVDTDTPGCNLSHSGTDCGYNVDLSTGEMAHLYYSTLGNVGFLDTSGSLTGCTNSSPPHCLTNTGPFSNLQPFYYWSGTTYLNFPSVAWNFDFVFGFQEASDKNVLSYAWAVRDGDVSPVPVPAAGWLFASALGLIGMARRKGG